MSTTEEKGPFPPEWSEPRPGRPPADDETVVLPNPMRQHTDRPVPAPGPTSPSPLPGTGVPNPPAHPVIPAQPGAPVSPAAPAQPGTPAGAPPPESGAPTAGGSVPAHPSAEETVLLPAFLTGRKPAEPKPAEPARHRTEGALPRNERGMLIFVAALLGLGTVAVVVMLGLGRLNTGSPSHPPRSVPASPTPAPTGPAAAVPGASASAGSTPAAAEALSATTSSHRPPGPTSATRRPSPTPALLGTADAAGYCAAHGGRLRLRRGWRCGRSDARVTADLVCVWQYGPDSRAAGRPDDPRTWRCYG